MMRRWSRRSLVKVALGGTATAIAKRNSAEASTTSTTGSADSVIDVAIVGGGFAGVTAARETSQAGLSTLLLEARPRLGGRTFTAKAMDHDLDLGGTWIGFQQPHVWTERTRYDIGIVESAASTGDALNLWPEGRRIVSGSSRKYMDILEPAMERWLAPAATVFPRPWDPTFTDGYREFDGQSAADSIRAGRFDARERDLLLGNACNSGHSFADKIGYLPMLRGFALSANSIPIEEANAAQYRLAGGTKALLDAIVSDVDAAIEMGRPVTRITHTGGLYSIERPGVAPVRARAVICAVPLNTLATIAFDPQISPKKLEASRERHAGSGIKLYVRVRGDYPLFSAQDRDTAPLSSLWTEYANGSDQIWVGFGASPDILDIHDQAAVAAAVRRFQPNAKIVDSVGYDWNADPYSRGTWACYKPTQFTKYYDSLQEPENGLFFAGSDIARGWAGNIDGAIETGIRAARQAVAHLGSA